MIIYKPSSLLRPYIPDTSALPMSELGLLPVVTTMGVPDVHGLLVLDFESGDFIQVFDMLRIPQGNVKVRVVTFDNNKFLRLYPSIE